MQEMNNEVIKEYFEHIQKKKNVYFYCCNKLKAIILGIIVKVYKLNWAIAKGIINKILCLLQHSVFFY